MDIEVIAGDFNFSDGWEEDSIIQNKYCDVWKKGKHHFSQWADDKMKQTGYTMPLTPRYPFWRPDHVIIRRR